MRRAARNSAKKRQANQPEPVRRQNLRRAEAKLRRQARCRFSQIRAAMPDLQSRKLNTHGVELTDDVWIFDKQGGRVPPPAYAVLTIDKLPRFQKSCDESKC